MFHGDLSGKIDEAQRRLAAAHALLSNAKVGDASDYLFWLDPWTDEGRSMAQRIRPYTHDLRILAESALVFIAQAEPKIRAAMKVPVWPSGRARFQARPCRSPSANPAKR